MLNEKILPDKYTELLYQLFVSKKWSIDGNEEISVFDRFCHRMAELEKDEDRDFILELTKNYLRIDLKEYEKLLIDVFRKVFKEQNIKLEKNERIFICPLLPESDFGKLKSSTMMLYVCQGTF